VAPSIEQWDYPERYTENLPRKPLQDKPSQDRSEIRQKALYHIRFLFTAIIVCACCITMMICNATIVEKRRAIKSLSTQLREAKMHNTELKADISEKLDLKYIEKVAIEKLNMSKPNKYQIVYIDVPKSNYTVQYNTDKSSEAAQGNKVLLSIKALMNGILKKNGDGLEK
jgi:cell division protein FtsL